MGETLKSGDASYDYRDGLSALRQREFIHAQEEAEKAVLNITNKKREEVEEQTTRLTELYRKLCGHEIKDQKVLVRWTKLYPVTHTAAGIAKANNYIADHCYQARTPGGEQKFMEEEFVLDGITLPQINNVFTAAFKLRRQDPKSEATYSHFYVAFSDIFRLDFMEQFNINIHTLPAELQQMDREARFFFDNTATFEDEDPKETAKRLARTMTGKLQPLIESRTPLMLSTPVYYTKSDHEPKTPDITESTRVDRTDDGMWDIIAGRALRIAVQRDYCEEPYDFKPFLVLRNDKDSVNYAVPADKPIEMFAL